METSRRNPSNGRRSGGLEATPISVLFFKDSSHRLLPRSMSRFPHKKLLTALLPSFPPSAAIDVGHHLRLFPSKAPWECVLCI
ncbi:unnamed protein product [Linum trigynum]|uniref:Uncharacterized protein n=1 Tax=Linum trigynum TaxID=586398 RepID=A0AAV2EAW4_9ROSI